MRTDVMDMIELQLRARGIRDERVLAAMAKVPREAFVPESLRGEAYDDHPLPIGEGQTISQPYMVAHMTELMGLSGTEKVLEIGTGSGYQAAVLAELAGVVHTVERFPSLSERARKIVSRLGYTNIRYHVGDGTLGWAQDAPYDRIIVTAAASRIPGPLLDQLAEGGKMVIPVGELFAQTLLEVRKTRDGITTRDIEGCVFVPLIGRYGMEEE